MNIKDILNSYFESQNGKKFQVLQMKSYKAEHTERRHKHVLILKPGHLAGISFRGAIVPNITLNDGIAELLSIRVNEKILSNPNDISYALGIKSFNKSADFPAVSILKDPIDL